MWRYKQFRVYSDERREMRACKRFIIAVRRYDILFWLWSLVCFGIGATIVRIVCVSMEKGQYDR
jgi:hypothetical protein